MKDTFKSFKLTRNSLVIQGSRCELSVSFADLAAIIEALSNALPSEPQESIATAGWSGSRVTGLPIDLAQHPKWTGRPERK